MEIDQNSTIQAIVSGNYRLADVFRKHGVDFCCPGNLTLSEAVKEMDLSGDILIRELREALQKRDPEYDLLRRLSPYDLVNHIVEYHHAYVRNTVPQVSLYLKRITADHSTEHPELEEVAELFHLAVKDLTSQMEKEELVLFPRIRRFSFDNGRDPDLDMEERNKITTTISELQKVHDTELHRLMRISMLTENYRFPDGECQTYFLTMKHLREFDDDLHRHLHLENNILFPKVIELE